MHVMLYNMMLYNNKKLYLNGFVTAVHVVINALLCFFFGFIFLGFGWLM